MRSRSTLRLSSVRAHSPGASSTIALPATPVNVSCRYKAAEIAYICDNAGAEVLVFHGSLGDRVAAALPMMPTVHTLLQVDDGWPRESRGRARTR